MYTLRHLVLFSLLVTAAGCESNSESERKPTGTPTDPVRECEKHGQVCRIDKSRLGVCMEPKEPQREAICQGRFPCLRCAPQH